MLFLFDFLYFWFYYFFYFTLQTNRNFSFHLSILWFMINLVSFGLAFASAGSLLQVPPWLMYNLWYLPLASRITKFKAPSEPKEPCRGAEGLQSPWGDWQGNSSVSLQEFSHKSTACWHYVFEALDLKDMKQKEKMTQMHLHFKITKAEEKSFYLSNSCKVMQNILELKEKVLICWHSVE